MDKGAACGKDNGRIAGKNEAEVTTVRCDWCEKDSKAASKFCEDCLTLYCDGCLASLHPQRGPFGHHKLVSAEKRSTSGKSLIECIQEQLVRYGAKDGAAKAENDTPGLSNSDRRQQGGETTTNPPVPTCEDDSLTFTLFCDTCSMVICTGTKCASRHNDHGILPVGKAYNRMRVPVDNKLKAITAMLVGLKELKINVTKLLIEIQTSLVEEVDEVNVLYAKCVNTYHRQQKSNLGDIEKKGAVFAEQCGALSRSANKWMEEMDSVVLRVAELLSGDPAVFLREAGPLGQRIERVLEKYYTMETVVETAHTDSHVATRVNVLEDSSDEDEESNCGNQQGEPNTSASSLFCCCQKTPRSADTSGQTMTGSRLIGTEDYSAKRACISEKMERFKAIMERGKELQKQISSSLGDIKETTLVKIKSTLEKYDRYWPILDNWKDSEVTEIGMKWLDSTAHGRTLFAFVDTWVDKTESAVAESAHLLSGDQAIFLNKCQKLCQRIDDIVEDCTFEMGEIREKLTEVQGTVAIKKKSKKPKTPPVPGVASVSLPECSMM